MKRKKFVNFSIIAFIIIGIVLLLGKDSWFPEFYNPVYMGVFSFISAFLLYYSKRIFYGLNQNDSGNLQSVIASALILNGFGSLGLYKLYTVGFEYDKLAHFIVPLIFIVNFVGVLNKSRGLTFNQSLIAVSVSIFLFGLFWEIFEFSSDILFGTETFGIYGKKIFSDTVQDILANVLGIFSGIFYLKLKNIKNN
ncbi:MAG: hypothetical protein AAB721_00695 [Patescibacteria group bacterium]